MSGKQCEDKPCRILNMLVKFKSKTVLVTTSLIMITILVWNKRNVSF